MMIKWVRMWDSKVCFKATRSGCESPLSRQTNLNPDEYSMSWKTNYRTVGSGNTFAAF